MRSDTGIRHHQQRTINEGEAHACDDARDDTMVSGRPVPIETESKPLFRTTSPKIEYAASSPYYDVLLYSFTPEEEQQRKQSHKTSIGSTVTKQKVANKPLDTALDDKSTSLNTASDSNTKYLRDQLLKSGTSVPTNDDDKIGDGDQSPIYDAYLHQVYLELFRTGGDFDAHIHKSSPHRNNRRYFHTTSTTNHPTLSIFAEHCVSGRVEKVKQILENNSVRKGKSWNVMIELLESRETVLRLSPLLLVFCMLHKVGIVMMNKSDSLTNVEAKAAKKDHSSSTEPWLKYIDQLEQNLVKVVSELLLYGASPMAKDVCGRTVYFYGASIYATPRSLNAVTMCSNAAMSAHYFGKEVILHGLTTTPNVDSNKLEICNGLRGLACGYQVRTGRRIVFLFGRQSEVAVSHRNIRLVNTTSTNAHQGSIPNLCNVQDRLGRVCLTELFGTKRIDVIKFLLDNHHASIDIEDWTGKTIRQRSFGTITNPTTKYSALSDVEMAAAQTIVTHALKCARQKQKRIDTTCTACCKTANDDSNGKKISVCQRCMSVRYCSESCQSEHWTKGGHRKECSRLRKLYFECIRIDVLSTTENIRSGKPSAFQKPSHIAVDEPFTIKIELIDQPRDVGAHVLRIYDKTVECDFELKLDNTSGATKYVNLLEKVKGEIVTAGTAVYLAASFDSKGVCSIYINRRKVRMW